MLIFGMGMLIGPHAPVATIMTAVACAIGLASVMALRNVAATKSAAHTNDQQPTTIVIDHTRDDGPKEPKLNI